MQSIIFTLYTKLVHTNEEKLVNKPAMQDIKTKAQVWKVGAALEGGDGGRQRANERRRGQPWGPIQHSLIYDSVFFLFFFKKEGVRNFFFFLEGDLLGDSSPSWSPPSAGSSASGSASALSTTAAEGAETGGELDSSAGSAGVSMGSSGVKSGRVCLRVAASLSSL